MHAGPELDAGAVRAEHGFFVKELNTGWAESFP